MSDWRTALDVVIVTHNSAAILPSCLRALGEGFSVLVVDNGSTDDTVEVAEGHAGVEVLCTGANLGYGAAANRALAATERDFVLLLNPDVEIEPESVRYLVDAMRAAPRAGLAGPRVRDPHGAISRSYGPALFRPGHDLFKRWLPRAIRRARPWTPTEQAQPLSVGYLIGCALLLRTSTVRGVGGFDERIFLYFEETDLCLRLLGRDHRLLYVPMAEAKHLGGGSSAKIDPTTLIDWHLEWSRFHLARKYPRQAGGRARLMLQLARLWLKAGLYLLLGRRVKRTSYAARAAGAWARLRGRPSSLR